VKTYGHFINGADTPPMGGKWIDSIDPYLGASWARIAQGSSEDVSLAVGAASRAMREGPGSTMTATNRGKLMLRLAHIISDNAERLAEIEVRDNGKLLTEMRHSSITTRNGGVISEVPAPTAEVVDVSLVGPPCGRCDHRCRR
jgi:acyl-CoA reductase-like NAD-dependent aldehyde dehydrogenase